MGCDALAHLHQRYQPFFAHALTPAGQRRTIERLLVLEKLFAAGVLQKPLTGSNLRLKFVIRIDEPLFKPTVAEAFLRQLGYRLFKVIRLTIMSSGTDQAYF